jgi:hypothetical protein
MNRPGRTFQCPFSPPPREPDNCHHEYTLRWNEMKGICSLSYRRSISRRATCPRIRAPGVCWVVCDMVQRGQFGDNPERVGHAISADISDFQISLGIGKLRAAVVHSGSSLVLACSDKVAHLEHCPKGASRD